jgi:hypothetical protein
MKIKFKGFLIFCENNKHKLGYKIAQIVVNDNKLKFKF